MVSFPIKGQLAIFLFRFLKLLNFYFIYKEPVLFLPKLDVWLIGKDPDAGKDWRQEEKGTTEDEMVGWMASLTRCTWIWASSRNWWWTGEPCMLQSMGSQRIRHNWTIELKLDVLDDPFKEVHLVNLMKPTSFAYWWKHWQHI